MKKRVILKLILLMLEAVPYIDKDIMCFVNIVIEIIEEHFGSYFD